jgi:hypothetical protein
MNADDFAVSLSRLAPASTELAAQGFSPLEAEAERESFMCGPRPGATPGENPLLDLLLRYDCSNIEIGMNQLIGYPVEHAVAWIVGKNEADSIILDKVTGEVLVTEYNPDGYSREDFVLSRCAKTSDMFLDAMVLAADYLQRLAVEFDRPDETVSRRYAQDCAQAAGGPDYLSHYVSLLG